MQNICIIVYTLMVTVHIKSIKSQLFINDNQSDNLGYKSSSHFQLPNTQQSHKYLGDRAENWFSLYKNYDDDNVLSSQRGYLTDLEAENAINSKYQNPQAVSDDDAVRLLLNTYLDLLQKDSKPSKENEVDISEPQRRYQKRALTMLSRWKPFRIPNSIGGNGRHVIRSPLNSRSDPSYSAKMPIVGRPFRWG